MMTGLTIYKKIEIFTFYELLGIILYLRLLRMTNKESKITTKDWIQVQSESTPVFPHERSYEDTLLERIRTFLLNEYEKNPKSGKYRRLLDTYHDCINQRKYFPNKHWWEFIYYFKEIMNEVKNKRDEVEERMEQEKYKKIQEQKEMSRKIHERAKLTPTPENIVATYESQVVRNFEVKYHKDRIDPIITEILDLKWGTITVIDTKAVTFPMMANIDGKQYDNLPPPPPPPTPKETDKPKGKKGSKKSETPIVITPKKWSLNNGNSKRPTYSSIPGLNWKQIHDKMKETENNSKIFKSFRAAFLQNSSGWVIYWIDLANPIDNRYQGHINTLEIDFIRDEDPEFTIEFEREVEESDSESEESDSEEEDDDDAPHPDSNLNRGTKVSTTSSSYGRSIKKQQDKKTGVKKTKRVKRILNVEITYETYKAAKNSIAEKAVARTSPKPVEQFKPSYQTEKVTGMYDAFTDEVEAPKTEKYIRVGGKLKKVVIHDISPAPSPAPSTSNSSLAQSMYGNVSDDEDDNKGFDLFSNCKEVKKSRNIWTKEYCESDSDSDDEVKPRLRTKSDVTSSTSTSSSRFKMTTRERRRIREANLDINKIDESDSDSDLDIDNI
jgi:hypothetical protein